MYGKIRNRDTKIRKPLQSRDLSTRKLGHPDHEMPDGSSSPGTDISLSLQARGRLDVFRYGDTFHEPLPNSPWETDNTYGPAAQDPDPETRVSSQTIAGRSDPLSSTCEEDISFHTARDSEYGYIISASSDEPRVQLGHKSYRSTSELPGGEDNAFSIQDCFHDLYDIDEFDEQIDDTELMSALDSVNDDGQGLATISGIKSSSQTVRQNWDDKCMRSSTQPGEHCGNGFSMDSPIDNAFEV
jgi:hypothetical protein